MYKKMQIILAIMLMFSFHRPAAAQNACSYDFAAVTRLMENAVATVPLDGASMLVIKDNKVLYERYFGNYATETTVLIASASKWLSGATLMTLVDEGKLSLDDPASKYLTYLTGTKATITLRQLFSHTSGFPGLVNDAPCIGNPLVSLDACARQIAALELIGPPGGQFAYGENSMQLAGRICEIASGKSWNALFQEKIAGPLEMSGTNFGLSQNPIIPAGTASGNATLTVTGGDGSLSIGTMPIAMVAPGLFTADATGRGLAAATVLRVKPDGSQVYEPVARVEAGKVVAVPIEVGTAGQQAYLILFGTGLRYRSGLAGLNANLGGIDVPVVFAGAQVSLVGLDQINLLLPASLAGRGEVDLVLSVDGKTANPVRLAFK